MKPMPIVTMTMANGGWPSTRPQRHAVERRRRTAPSPRRRQHAEPERQAEQRDGGQRNEAAEHHQVALGEVDRLGRLVDQREAQRDQAEHAAHGETADDELEELDHVVCRGFAFAFVNERARSVAEANALRSHSGDVARTTTNGSVRVAGEGPAGTGGCLGTALYSLKVWSCSRSRMVMPTRSIRSQPRRSRCLSASLVRWRESPAQLGDLVLRNLERPLGARGQDGIEQRRERKRDPRVRLEQPVAAREADELLEALVHRVDDEAVEARCSRRGAT